MKLEHPYTRKQLAEMQEKDGSVKATISVPWDETGDIDALNDLASKAITGSEVALEDISYRLAGADVDAQEVLLEVEGTVENWLESESGDELTDVVMLDGTKWLLMAEIENDRESADIDDVTLGLCLESVQGGYSPDPDELVDMEPVEADLKRLIAAYGEDTRAEDFVSGDDWQERASGDIQARARKGH
jgi:hypothetical protein